MAAKRKSIEFALPLESLQLDNFKSWRQVGPMRLAPLTGLLGTNSSGKTSLMQFLAMPKQTAESPDRNLVLDLGDPRSIVELGTFRDVVHRHDLASTLQWRLAWRLREPMSVADPAALRSVSPTGDAVEYAASVRWQKSGPSASGRMTVANLAYQLAGRNSECTRSPTIPANTGSGHTPRRPDRSTMH